MPGCDVPSIADGELYPIAAADSSAADPVPVPSWIADLHIHSKYSLACSRDLTVATLTAGAMTKGITLLGTGDFTHPAWFEHLRADLVPAEDGLYRPGPDLESQIRQTVPPKVAARDVRFMFSVEISTIYKRDDRTRKVHHLVYLPDVPAVERFNTRLGRVGNLGSDGRPILGLDSRDLLEIVLESSDDGYLVPAHIWTPWFSALGSKSGFDRIADCYADLAEHIFAVETGLSSDPAMNWRVSSLDRYRLVSNSDAHSLPALGREATILRTGLDYFSVREALRTGTGLAGTLEFFPEEGKYHADGHRTCGVSWTPAETAERDGLCIKCGKPVTVGVLSRVEDLADEPDGRRPAATAKTDVEHLVQLSEILGEIYGVGARSRSVGRRLDALVAALGPELYVLREAPIDDVRRAGGELLGEAIRRLRSGDVRRTPGFDGEYGVIRLFDPGEIGSAISDALFELPENTAARTPNPAARTPDPAARTPNSAKRSPNGVTPTQHATAAGETADHSVPAQRQPRAPKPRTVDRPAEPPLAAPASPHEPFEPMLAGMEEVGTGLLDRLDAMQRVAASAPGGPMLIVAGPGTGKTRTLTHRIAYLCAELNVRPDQCLAITFTRRAAEEVGERLSALLGSAADDITVATFHALALTILRDHAARAGLANGFRVADDTDRTAAIEEATTRDGVAKLSATQARRALAMAVDDGLRERYLSVLRRNNLVDVDELVTLAVDLLGSAPDLVAAYRRRWSWTFVDEYQDVDPSQFDLLRLLCPADGNLCAIGDPDQAIYAFRGADVSHFQRFAADYVDARVVRLARNYRSSAPILATAVQAIAPTTLVPGRRIDPARSDPEAPQVGRYAAASTADEADFVVRTTDALVGGVSHRSLDSGRVDGRDAVTDALSFSDIAVLYRTDAQSGPVLEALTRAGIPVQKRSHDRLRDRPAVSSIARELRFAPEVASDSVSGAGSVVARVRRAGAAVIDRLRTPTLDTDVDSAHAITEADVHLAVEVLTPLATRCGNDLSAFLTEVATDADVDALDPRAQAVTLLTLHAAKGLEFPVVFIVGCEDGLLPLRMPGRDGVPADEAAEAAAIAEERRLFFVGLTRAQDRLFVSHVRRRFWRGAEREMTPSRFFDAIDPRLFDNRGDLTPRRPRDQQLRLL
jgi:DNA helicase II / ATP-dependent DNA helicase PcrA